MKRFSILAGWLIAVSLSAQQNALDPTFGQTGRLTFGFDGVTDTHDPTAVAIQPDEKIVVAGFAFHLPGVANSHIGIARLLPGGAFDPSFSGDGKAGFVLDPAAQFNVPRAINLLPDGKILVYCTAGSDLYLLRLQADGQPDPGFGTNGVVKINRPLAAESVSLSSHQLLVQSNGKIGVFFRQRYLNLNAVVHVALRLNANGTFDPTFGGTGRVVVDSIAFNQPGGFDNVRVALSSGNKLLFAGDTLLQVTPGNVFRLKLLRLNTDGTKDLAFGNQGALVFPNADILPNALLLDATQNMYIGGMKGGLNAVVKIKPNGTFDSDYGTNGIATGGATDFVMVNGGMVLKNGDAVLAGVSNSTGFIQTVCKSFDETGALNQAFGNAGIVLVPQAGDENTLRAMALQADGKIVLAGRRRQTEGAAETDFELVRLAAPVSETHHLDEAPEVAFWPNPARNQLTVSLANGPATLMLFDLAGRVLHDWPLYPGEQILHLPSLPAGMYLLRFGFSDGISMMRSLSILPE
ncbi:MAG: T9SS type A sorting domain-containing protein [Saprospiraceae bacterium]|nr:T9SS type A sorting domain-containing protein [Saprospiraceae bacterium]